MTFRTHADAVDPLFDALLSTARAATSLTNLLGDGDDSVYDSEPTWKSDEQSPAEPYVVLTAPTADQRNHFNSLGGLIAYTIDIWAAEAEDVRLIYAELTAALTPRQTLTGMRHLSSKLSLLATVKDPGPRRLWHGIVRYEGQVNA